MKPFPPHIVKALEAAFAGLKKDHGLDEEEAMNEIIKDWLTTNEYLRFDASDDMEVDIEPQHEE